MTLRRHLLLASLLICALALINAVRPVGPVQAQSAGPFRVYLTFEDGPTDAYTPDILDTLASYGARATFLIAGDRIAGHEALLQREVREGHGIVNHLWSEPGLYAAAPREAVIKSYLRTEAALRAALGDMLPLYDTRVKMFWQPGGGARALTGIDGVQVLTYNWNVNSDDCGWAMPSTVDLNSNDFDRSVIANVLGLPVSVGNSHSPYNAYDYGDGVIVAFHDLNRVTGRVLPTIMSELQAAGATFEALPRPGDAIDTMPVVIARAPQMGAGLPGATIPATTREGVNLRGGPSLQAVVIETLKPGTTVTAIGRANGWIQVRSGATTGWALRSLLDGRGPIPNLPAVQFTVMEWYNTGQV